MIHTSKIGFSLALIHQKDIIQSNSCNAFRVTVHWKYLCHRSEHLEKANAYGCCGTCKKKKIYIYIWRNRKEGRKGVAPQFLGMAVFRARRTDTEGGLLESPDPSQHGPPLPQAEPGFQNPSSEACFHCFFAACCRYFVGYAFFFFKLL